MQTEYMKFDSQLPLFMQFPNYLWEADIGNTAKLVYVLLYDRARLSLQNGWLDDDGHVYIVYPIKHIAIQIGKGETAVKRALAELEVAGLMEKKRSGFGKANHLYIMIPSGGHISGGGKVTISETQNSISVGRKSDCQTGRKASANKRIESRNKSKKTTVSSRLDFVSGKKISGQGKAFFDYSYEEGESL